MKICSVENCNRKHQAKGYCGKHYAQLRHCGKILEKSIYDPNDFIIDGDICWIILCNRKCEEIARSKFDTKYYEIIKNYRWHLSSGYVQHGEYDENNQPQKVFLHQAIIDLSGQTVPPGCEIDHKDRDPLNNLLINLRICTKSQNAQNSSLRGKNTSGFKGICQHNTQWIAQIYVNGNPIHIGTFSIKEDAAKAYNVEAIKYFGEFAKLNDI